MCTVTTEGSLQGTRVLIAHASESARTAMRAVLEGVGCAVAEASTREQLLEEKAEILAALAQRCEPHGEAREPRIEIVAE